MRHLIPPKSLKVSLVTFYAPRFQPAAPRTEDLERFQVSEFVPALPGFIGRTHEADRVSLLISEDANFLMVDSGDVRADGNPELQNPELNKSRQYLGVLPKVNIVE
jgi:hypothetical protein